MREEELDKVWASHQTPVGNAELLQKHEALKKTLTGSGSALDKLLNSNGSASDPSTRVRIQRAHARTSTSPQFPRVTPTRTSQRLDQGLLDLGFTPSTKDMEGLKKIADSHMRRARDPNPRPEPRRAKSAVALGSYTNETKLDYEPTSSTSSNIIDTMRKIAPRKTGPRDWKKDNDWKPARFDESLPDQREDMLKPKLLHDVWVRKFPTRKTNNPVQMKMGPLETGTAGDFYGLDISYFKGFDPEVYKLLYKKRSEITAEELALLKKLGPSDIGTAEDYTPEKSWVEGLDPGIYNLFYGKAQSLDGASPRKTGPRDVQKGYNERSFEQHSKFHVVDQVLPPKNLFSGSCVGYNDEEVEFVKDYMKRFPVHPSQEAINVIKSHPPHEYHSRVSWFRKLRESLNKLAPPTATPKGKSSSSPRGPLETDTQSTEPSNFRITLNEINDGKSSDPPKQSYLENYQIRRAPSPRRSPRKLKNDLLFHKMRSREQPASPKVTSSSRRGASQRTRDYNTSYTAPHVPGLKTLGTGRA